MHTLRTVCATKVSWTCATQRPASNQKNCGGASAPPLILMAVQAPILELTVVPNKKTTQHLGGISLLMATLVHGCGRRRAQPCWPLVHQNEPVRRCEGAVVHPRLMCPRSRGHSLTSNGWVSRFLVRRRTKNEIDEARSLIWLICAAQGRKQQPANGAAATDENRNHDD